MPLQHDVQSLQPGDLVILFDLDLAKLGGGVLRFVPGNLGDAEVRWRGNAYKPVPVQAQGFERTGRGQLPTPTMTIAATDIVVASMLTFDDLRGCRVVRWRTFKHYLDGQPQADPNVFFPLDIYEVERKSNHDTKSGTIEWELSASMDQQGKMVPGRIMTQDYCPWRYRHWNGTGFDYSNAECTYHGNASFKANGDPTSDPSQDRCGKKFSDCQKRFGATNPLFYGGFPGISRSSS
jgi:lambda family phage minor tail protein L